MMNKPELRTLMRTRRGALTFGEKIRASRELCARLSRHPFFIAATRVGIYYPNDGEVDVTPVAIRRSPRRYYLPVLPARGKLRLWFGAYKPGQRLIKDRFGILEPAGFSRIRAEELDLVLVPLVAFDRWGGRVGMGGGFYDTSLGFMQQRGKASRTRAIGVAYHFQQIESIPDDHWDVPLHGIVTDREFIPASRS
jgi:5-formyltetrahydrofolate cyclo-ligase